jgi:hypothetical protein
VSVIILAHDSLSPSNQARQISPCPCALFMFILTPIPCLSDAPSRRAIISVIYVPKRASAKEDLGLDLGGCWGEGGVRDLDWGFLVFNSTDWGMPTARILPSYS